MLLASVDHISMEAKWAEQMKEWQLSHHYHKYASQVIYGQETLITTLRKTGIHEPLHEHRTFGECIDL